MVSWPYNAPGVIFSLPAFSFRFPSFSRRTLYENGSDIFSPPGFWSYTNFWSLSPRSVDLDHRTSGFQNWRNLLPLLISLDPSYATIVPLSNTPFLRLSLPLHGPRLVFSSVLSTSFRESIDFPSTPLISRDDRHATKLTSGSFFFPELSSTFRRNSFPPRAGFSFF